MFNFCARERCLSVCRFLQNLSPDLHGMCTWAARNALDVRDVAQAHINAAIFPSAANKRYIVGNEARLHASRVAAAISERVGEQSVPFHMTFQDAEAGASIAVGEQEVEAAQVLWDELGIRCRPTSETLADMAQRLLRLEPTHIVRA